MAVTQMRVLLKSRPNYEGTNILSCLTSFEAFFLIVEFQNVWFNNGIYNKK